ncbi:hypothetical protein DFR50_15124 [Roseiarcus fermentans]|uniref:Uncharacterized protein n=1 Tax=Roseiarcus fermentans TaxID=1473586 RepID=A0A366EJL5_9HYPH|nr:hypothetical protein DFR50_15124 [Roseiarcus fermentans]
MRRRDGVGGGQLNFLRPFARPDSSRICIKVINHFGDEVQKVFRV